MNWRPVTGSALVHVWDRKCACICLSDCLLVHSELVVALVVSSCVGCTASFETDDPLWSSTSHSWGSYEIAAVVVRATVNGTSSKLKLAEPSPSAGDRHKSNNQIKTTFVSSVLLWHASTTDNDVGNNIYGIQWGGRQKGRLAVKHSVFLFFFFFSAVVPCKSYPAEPKVRIQGPAVHWITLLCGHFYELVLSYNNVFYLWADDSCFSMIN